jgi:hypothetical protein
MDLSTRTSFVAKATAAQERAVSKKNRPEKENLLFTFLHRLGFTI